LTSAACRANLWLIRQTAMREAKGENLERDRFRTDGAGV
jgi:hypothetical protein